MPGRAMNRNPSSLRRLGHLLVYLLILLSFAGCGISADSEPPVSLVELPAPVATPSSAPAASRRVALVMKTLTNPFFIEMEKGARRAEAELDVQLIVKTAAQETSIDQQIAIVEGLIADRVDAIVVAPGDSTSLVPVLKRAQDAGIVIVNVDNRLDVLRSAELGLKDVPFISVDNREGAYQAAQAISARIVRPTKVAIIEGIRSARNAADRKQGALRAFAENPNVEVIATETAHWKIDEAYDVTRRLFQAHPDIGAIFCANDMMALGAIRFLGDSGRSNVLVAGFDALDQARRAVHDGTLLATVDQQAARQGYLGVEYAVRMLAGEHVPPETLVQTILVDRAAVPD